VPAHAAKGSDVLLRVRNRPENVRSYSWHKGAAGLDSHQIAVRIMDPHRIAPGPKYSGRETRYPNGSLLVQNVKQEDAGFYALWALTRALWAQQASGELRVYWVVLCDLWVVRTVTVPTSPLPALYPTLGSEHQGQDAHIGTNTYRSKLLSDIDCRENDGLMGNSVQGAHPSPPPTSLPMNVPLRMTPLGPYALHAKSVPCNPHRQAQFWEALPHSLVSGSWIQMTMGPVGWVLTP
jgi:hypothetical protein